MSHPARPKALLIRVGRTDPHWWWDDVDHEALGCELVCRTLPLGVTRVGSPFSWTFVQLAARTLRMLLQARRERFAYVFTFENDWLTLLIASAQTLFLFRRPRHVILQFIMREPTPDLKSRVKYAFMRWCFRSVHLCVCSSRPEAEFYLRAFGWPKDKVAFVPFHTDPAFVKRADAGEELFAVAAGRTFRDYPTLLEAARRGLDLPVTIVAGRSGFGTTPVPDGVTVKYDIPLPDLIALMARAAIVVLPLTEREISTGQSVLLEAMAMGKPVVVTRVNGTVDYIDHLRTGMLVPPNDPDAMRDAINQLAADPDLRRRIGAAGREQVLEQYLPNHYAQGVARVLKERR
jgi:glycosyltransferase involved in cell wall biosynthesis